MQTDVSTHGLLLHPCFRGALAASANGPPDAHDHHSLLRPNPQPTEEPDSDDSDLDSNYRSCASVASYASYNASSPALSVRGYPGQTSAAAEIAADPGHGDAGFAGTGSAHPPLWRCEKTGPSDIPTVLEKDNPLLVLSQLDAAVKMPEDVPLPPYHNAHSQHLHFSGIRRGLNSWKQSGGDAGPEEPWDGALGQLTRSREPTKPPKRRHSLFHLGRHHSRERRPAPDSYAHVRRRSSSAAPSHMRVTVVGDFWPFAGGEVPSRSDSLE